MRRLKRKGGSFGRRSTYILVALILIGVPLFFLGIEQVDLGMLVLIYAYFLWITRRE